MNQKKYFTWANFGKLSLVIGVIWTIIQIADKLFSYNGNLEASIITIEYPIPDKANKAYSYQGIYDVSDLITDSLLKMDTTLNYNDINDLILPFLENHYYIKFFNNLFGYKLTVLGIRNNSNKTIENINVDVDCNGIFQYNNVEGVIHSSTFNNNIKIGELRALNEAKLNIWTSSFECRNPRINFNGGVIIPKEKIMVSGFYSWLYKRRFLDNFFMILFMSIICIVIWRIDNAKKY